MSNIKCVRGFRDIICHGDVFRELINRFLNILSNFGCRFIMLPTIEYENLFYRSLGADTDIITKEMFKLQDEEDLVLRPELTTSVLRAMYNDGCFIKNNRNMTFGDCFRRERPQKGRYRQFYQLSVELLGNIGITEDLECLMMVWECIKILNYENLVISINTIGSREERQEYLKYLICFLHDNHNNLSLMSKERLFRKQYWRILDSKEDVDKIILQNAPKLYDFLGEKTKIRFETIIKFLKDYNIPYEISPNLIRGLDYYNDLVFEVIINHSRSNQNSICGGGRYDLLGHHLFGRNVPAIGFAFGMDRVLELYQHQKISLTIGVVFLTPNYQYLHQINELRHKFKVVTLDFNILTDALRFSDKNQYSYLIIIGDEMPSFTVKDLRTGEQHNTIDVVDFFCKIRE